MNIGIMQPRFELTNHDGTAITEDAFAGYYTLVYFGFTHCRVVCPRNLKKLDGVFDLLDGHSSRFQAFFITVDPDRDKPEVMRAYLQEKHPRIMGLTGDAEAVGAAKKAFRVFAEKKDPVDSAGSYDVPHTSLAYLIGPNQEYVAHFAEHISAEEIASRLRDLFVD